jgi:hypothetical protein
MKILFLFLLSFPIYCFSQNFTEERIRQVFCIRDEDFQINEYDLLDNFANFDFSPIFLTNTDPIGFIGDNYQRFYIHFDLVQKNCHSSTNYQVYGKTKVKENICSFQGNITLMSVRLLNEDLRLAAHSQAETHKDNELFNRTKYPVYILLASYNFYEDKEQKYSGTFTGYLKSAFYIKGDSLCFNDLERGFSDDYSNNQFAGIWQMYNSKIQKKCNWGISRIPCSRDLDIGVGFFSPNEKYLKNGWENYYSAYIEQNEEAIKMENRRWWKE